MMSRALLARLLSIRNAVPALMVVMAFASLFFENTLLSRDKVILALLGFLAIDSVVHRVARTGRIEEQLSRLQHHANDIADPRFAFRGGFGTTEDLLRRAQKEFWVSGVAFDAISHMTDIIIERVSVGVHVRLLAIADEQGVVNDTARYLGDNEAQLKQRLEANLGRLHQNLVSKYPKRVEIRVSSHRPALGYFIVDPDLSDGYMRVETYTVASGRNQRPMFQLSAMMDSPWFDAYKSDFDALWQNALTWSPEPRKESQ